MPSLTRPLWLALALVPSLALADPQGSLEAGVLAFGQTLVGEVHGGAEVYDFVPSEAGFGIALGVEWPLGATVSLGGELGLGIFGVATQGLDADGHQFHVHLGPRLRLGFPLADAIALEAIVGLAPGYITAPGFGSVSATTRVGIGASYAIDETVAVMAGASHLMVIGWPVEALSEDIRVLEPLFRGLSGFLFTVGVRGLR